MKYPNVIPEQETINAILSGKSIARFGDGEIKLIKGRDCVSQKANDHISAELRAILATPSDVCLTGIMNFNGPTAKENFWGKYREKNLEFYNPDKTYHSSFISRPDSKPNINTAEYWDSVARIWKDKRILLVTGGRSSAIQPYDLTGALHVTHMAGPEKDSYGFVDGMEDQIKLIHAGGNFDAVMICLGPTATCLAWRLAHKGIQALDLGHLGLYHRRFMRGEPIGGKSE